MKCKKHPSTDLEIRASGKGNQLRTVFCPDCDKAKKAAKPDAAGQPPSLPSAKKPDPPPASKPRRGLFF